MSISREDCDPSPRTGIIFSCSSSHDVGAMSISREDCDLQCT